MKEIPLSISEFWGLANGRIAFRAWRQKQTSSTSTKLWAFKAHGDVMLICSTEFFDTPSFCGIPDTPKFEKKSPKEFQDILQGLPPELRSPRGQLVFSNDGRLIKNCHLLALVPLMMFHQKLRDYSLSLRNKRSMNFKKEIINFLEMITSQGWQEACCFVG